MIRIEIARRVLVKQGKGRHRINPVSVIFEPDLASALEEVARWQEVTEDSATMPFEVARLYDNAAYLAHLRDTNSDSFNPEPLKVIKAHDSPR
jgi:hypothetical protein